MIVKMTILRLLGSSDDKEKIGVARPEGPPLRWSQGSALKPLRSKGRRIEETVKKPSQRNQDRDTLVSPVMLGPVRRSVAGEDSPAGDVCRVRPERRRVGDSCVPCP